MADEQRIGINPEGILKPVSGRMKRQSANAKALGLSDPYKRPAAAKGRKKKPKKKASGGLGKGIRRYLLGKFPKYKKLLDALE